MTSNIKNTYTGDTGQAYYDMRQARRSDFVQERRAGHFQPFLQETDHVLDFGCGTGGVLRRLQCAQKTGIEVNPPSIAEAEAAGLTVYPELSRVDDSCVDVVISNHALEHVLDPARQISDMVRVLKEGGRTVLVVPSENPGSSRFHTWRRNDPDHHIYSWTPLSFGNLVGQCGLTVEQSFRRPIGYSKFIEPLADLHEGLFQTARKVVAFALDRYEIVCIARKTV
ncbi:MAG: methyltransferase domain-containing protein [Rhodospirillales bacterium]|nr:methyltransferase domain-containing protein [Rhodospirillales bacterium]MCB9964610.1 methyltransferase domain-containing protein [Rhodospirillales bacterium]MCB9979899.1 methyltransferase domain-containing protein [Rhodospirillales bacterium]